MNGLGRKIIDFRKHQTIFSQGDDANAVFYIQKGRVRLTVISKRGKEATIALLGSRDFLGEECIAGIQPQRMATAASGGSAHGARADVSRPSTRDYR